MVGSLFTLVWLGRPPVLHGLSRDDVQHSSWFRWGAVRDLLTPWGAWSSDCVALQDVRFPSFSYQALFDFLCIFCCFLSTVLELSKEWFKITGEKRRVRKILFKQGFLVFTLIITLGYLCLGKETTLWKMFFFCSEATAEDEMGKQEKMGSVWEDN